MAQGTSDPDIFHPMPTRPALAPSLLSLLIAVTTPSAALAVTQFNEGFDTAAGLGTPSDWVMAESGGTTCLTAYSDAVTPVATLGEPLPACVGAPDPDGEGALRLTGADLYVSGSMLYDHAIATADGIGVHFFMAMYGGNEFDGTGADGVSFYLKDGANTSTALGQFGFGLGYAGLQGALLGVGFDAYGNFSNPGYFEASSEGCESAGTEWSPQSVVLRSGDASAGQDGTVGYCYLSGVSGIEYAGASRLAAAKEVLITVDSATDDSPMVRVYLGPVGELPSSPTLVAPAPAEYLAVDSFKFGFAASTGAGTNLHEIWGLRVGEEAAVREFLVLPSTSQSADSWFLFGMVLLVVASAVAGVGLLRRPSSTGDESALD